MPNTTETKLDDFTRTYIEAALWSSTVEPFGECVQCGKEAPLVQHAANVNSVYKDEWTLCGNCGDAGGNSYEPPADDNYSIEDLAEETLARMLDDCAKFQAENDEWITDQHLTNANSETLCDSDEKAGHDFWLTRNGHGAGFWDGDWSDSADAAMTAASKRFGGCDLYVGDDGKLYLS